MRVVGDNPLSANQHKTIIALLSTTTVKEAAEEVGVGESTVRRWLTDPDFMAVYRTARGRFLEAAMSGLQSTVAGAVQALERNLNCGVASVEVRAAQAILDRVMKAEELFSITARVEALEEAEKLRNASDNVARMGR